jgi:hypothetical protein
MLARQKGVNFGPKKPAAKPGHHSLHCEKLPRVAENREAIFSF